MRSPEKCVPIAPLLHCTEFLRRMRRLVGRLMLRRLAAAYEALVLRLMFVLRVWLVVVVVVLAC